MDLQSKLVGMSLAILLALVTGGILSCGSGDSGPPGPEEVAKEYIEAGKVEDLEKFMDLAMFGISDVFEVGNVETTLVSKTETEAEVFATCDIQVEGGGGFRGNEVEMTLMLEKGGEEWAVSEVRL